MRVLLLADCYFPSTKSCAKLIHDLAHDLVAQGHEVLLIAPIDEAPGSLTVEPAGSLTVVRVRTGAIKGMPLPLRALRELIMPHVLWHATRKLLRERRIDLTVYYSPSIFFGPLVRRVKRLWHCPAYLVLRDIFPKWARDCGVLKDGPVFRFFQREAIRQYDQADVIGVESEGSVRYFAEEFPGRYKVEVLHNWQSLDEGKIEPGRHREKLGLQDKIVFCYGGNMGVAQGMDAILHLVRALRGLPEVRFLLVGEGSEVARIQQVVRDEGLDNVVLLPPVEHHAYLGMLSEADVGVVSLARELKAHNVPGKVLSYMYLSLPILASLNPGNDMKALVHRHDAGLCVDAGDDAGLVEAARRLAADPALRGRLGKNARQLLETQFSSSAAAHQITGHSNYGRWE